jgi:heat-inducible transcriptional repressor
MKKNIKRLDDTLKSVIDEFTKNSEPVSSRILCENYMSHVSPATLRIDLTKLEQQNYILQPHTSAGRIPTINGYRRYIEIIKDEVQGMKYDKIDVLRQILIRNYKDTQLALHYIKQILANESDQLSFVAEPEVSNDYLSDLQVFQLSPRKLIFVLSLDSGLDKTVILNCDYDVNDIQLKKMVRFVREDLIGERIFDISHRYLNEMSEMVKKSNFLLEQFLQELHKAFTSITDYYIQFDGKISFLEQPEFDNKMNVMNFMTLVQRQDILIRMMRNNDRNEEYNILMGEDFGDGSWYDFAVIYARYEVFDIPGYLGMVCPVRNDYRRNITMIRDFAKTITQTTKQGIVTINK